MGVVARERDSLRKILASYDAEEAQVIERARAHWQGQGQGQHQGRGRGGMLLQRNEPQLTPEKSKQARLQVSGGDEKGEGGEVRGGEGKREGEIGVCRGLGKGLLGGPQVSGCKKRSCAFASALLLQELESLLEERGQQLVAKDAQLEQARAAAAASTQALSDLRDQLEREEEEKRREGGVGRGEAEVQALRQRVAELEEKVRGNSTENSTVLYCCIR